MNVITRGILAIILGAVIGSAANMGIIMIGDSIIPSPDGVDVSTMESIAASMHLYEPRHFAPPFLAHSIGTLIGAFTAGVIAMNSKMMFSLCVGVMFLGGGVYVSFMLPAPAWFIVLDLVVAYIPMGWLGGTLAVKLVKDSSAADGVEE